MTDTMPAPSAALVDEAAEMLGCIPMTDRVAAKWCGIHGHWDTFMDGLPCPVAVDLAAKIAARDARRRLDRPSSCPEPMSTHRKDEPMSDTPKMIRETLCVAQTAVGLLPDDYQAGRTRDEHIAQLQRLHDAIVDVPESTHARDARRDAQKSELIRVVHDDDLPTRRAQVPFLDEFVARGVNVHFEAMSSAQFWIGIDFADGTHWAINCGAVNPNAKGYAFAEQDSP